MEKTAEYKEKSIKTTLFQDNSIPYRLCFIAAILELWYTLSVLDVIAVNYLMGIITFINIVLLFALFAGAVKLNVYDKHWSIRIIILGIYTLIRAFILLPLVVKPYDRVAELLWLNIIVGVLLLVAGFMTLDIIKKRTPYYDELMKGLENE